MPKYGGIDLGTTYTSISYYDDDNNRVDTVDLVDSADGAKTLRSVVYYPGPGEPPVVGSAAWNVYRQCPEQVVVGIKRSMGTSFRLPMHGEELTPPQISAEILKTVVSDAERNGIGEPLAGVVITVPAYFGDAERAATEEAGQLAGLNVMALLPEPHAAALAYAIEKVTNILDRYLLVYDLGGGTFDVTLIHASTAAAAGAGGVDLKIETLCKDGNANLGGLDWDRALAGLVAQKAMDQYGVDVMSDARNEALLLDNCEKAKRDLGRISQVATIADMAGHQVNVTVSEFEDVTHDLLYQTRALLEQVIEDAQKVTVTERDGTQHAILKEDIDVMLTGGSSKMPMVKRMVEAVLGKPPFTHKNPELLVTIGAAYWAYLLQGNPISVPDPNEKGKRTDVNVSQKGITDTARHGVGVEVLRPDGQGGYRSFMSTILPANGVYEQEYSRTFRTSEDDMEIIPLVLYEGDSDDLGECTKLLDAVITGLPPGRPAGQPVKVTLHYDSNGILRGTAVDVNSGKDCVMIVDRSGAA